MEVFGNLVERGGFGSLARDEDEVVWAQHFFLQEECFTKEAFDFVSLYCATEAFSGIYCVAWLSNMIFTKVNNDESGNAFSAMGEEVFSGLSILESS